MEHGARATRDPLTSLSGARSMLWHHRFSLSDTPERSDDYGLRPIWHQLDRGIAAHLLIAVLAYRAPLCRRALEVLHEARALSDEPGLVFPSAHGRAISDNTISKLLRDLGIEAVPHGFRSSFRDWAAECSDPPREVCELGLAHGNSDQVEAAYRRTDLFERRRVLMEEWSGFVGRSAGSEECQTRKSDGT